MAEHSGTPPPAAASPSAASPSPAPAPSQAPAAAAAAAGSSSTVQVFQPVESASEPVPDAFFEHSLSDVQAYHSSMLSRTKQLTDAPLLTAKHRDAELAEREKKKADKWPTTTIRVKFSDGTQIQRVFPSSSPIQPVYEFVRESLAPSARTHAFTLYQPPRTMFPEKPAPVDPKSKAKKHPNPAMKPHIVAPAGYAARGGVAASMVGGTGGNESLAQLGLVPQSMLLIKWDDPALNASGAPAPLTEELRALAAPLPAPKVAEPTAGKDAGAGAGKKLTADKMPKWLQKGLMKKK